MPARKTCFMISPIGDDQSDIRAEADALLWIAQQALTKYDFEVIRVDQIARSTVITSEIIQLIQEAELCLIVLTGQNPNVFYEAGRRHETGKPFIQLIKKGNNIPFDIASIRTIIYDEIDSRVATAKTINDIQRYIDEFEKSGYGSSGTGVSLSTLAASIDRIERKIGQLIERSHLIVEQATDSDTIVVSQLPEGSNEITQRLPGLTRIVEAMKDPREAFMEALANGDLKKGAALLGTMENYLPPREMLLASLIFVRTRHEPAVEIAIRILTDHLVEIGFPDTLNNDDKDAVIPDAIGTVCSYMIRLDRELEAMQRIKPIIDKILDVSSLTPVGRAFYLNQIQRLHYGLGEYETAMQILDEVIDLAPNNISYLYNASITAAQLSLTQKSLTLVDRYMAIGTHDDDHLYHAVKTYVVAQRLQDAREAYISLRNVSVVKSLSLGSEIMDALNTVL